MGIRPGSMHFASHRRVSAGLTECHSLQRRQWLMASSMCRHCGRSGCLARGRAIRTQASHLLAALHSRPRYKD